MGDTTAAQEQNAREAVAQAQAIFDASNVCIELVIQDVRQRCPQEGGTDAEELVDGERGPTAREGVAEVQGNRAIKLWFFEDIAGRTGFAWHRQPVVFAEGLIPAEEGSNEDPETTPHDPNDPNGPSKADRKRGQTVAHELGHVLTINAHTSDGLMKEGPHNEEKIGKNTKKEIEKGAFERERRKIKGEQKALELEFGYVLDEESIQLAGHEDLAVAIATLPEGESDLTLYVMLRGLVPTTGLSEYHTGFDTDDNLATGVSVGGIAGFDVIVSAKQDGTKWTFELTDASGSSRPVLGVAISENEFACGKTDAGVQGAMPTYTTLSWSVSPQYLPWKPDQSVFRLVSATGSLEAPYDVAVFSFDRERHLHGVNLRLATAQSADVLVGGDVDIEGSGFESDAVVIVSVDTIVVATLVADAAGSVIGTVTIPMSTGVGPATISCAVSGSELDGDFILIEVYEE